MKLMKHDFLLKSLQPQRINGKGSNMIKRQMYVCVYVYMCVCMYVWMNEWMYVCMYVLMYLCMCK